MNTKELEIRKQIEDLAEKKYQEFSAALIPNCHNIIGVRIPLLRKIAKDMMKDQPSEALEYFKNSKEVYFEETMLKGFLVGNIKDLDLALELIPLYVPKITNWSLCDSFCVSLKITKKHKGTFWDFLKSYWQSDQPYHIRFAVVMFLDYYITEEYLQDLFHIFDQIKHEDYYVKMGVAWAISMCFVAFPKETMEYFKSNNLDDETYNKALQKTRESTKVDASTKALLKTMKRQ